MVSTVSGIGNCETRLGVEKCSSNGTTSQRRLQGSDEGHGFSRAAQSQPMRALALEVRVSMLRSDHNLPCNNRTSAAKAAHAQGVYGTAEAVPFVQRLPCRKPNLDKSALSAAPPFDKLRAGSSASSHGTLHGRPGRAGQAGRALRDPNFWSGGSHADTIRPTED
jgi:hypothetical protein